MRRHPTVKALSLAFGRLDKAKTNIVHKNKASASVPPLTPFEKSINPILK